MKSITEAPEYANVLIQGYKRDTSQWDRSWAAMKQALARQFHDANSDSYAGLESDLHKFYKTLQDTHEFNEGIQQANTRTRNTDPWIGHTLFSDGDMEVSLNVYFGNHNTPIHDRARATEAFVVLSGRVNIQTYATIESPIQSHYPIVKLARRESQTYDHHQVCLIHTGVNSVQEISAQTGRCVVLRLSLIDCDTNIPCWYFPISPQQNEEFFTQRVKQY